MDMISEVERASLYNVQSLNNTDETYEVCIENDTPEPEPELQREQEDMVQKLKMLKEVVENLRPDEITSSWQLQVEQLYREVVLRSKQVKELPSGIHLERQRR
ncbi:hypothetical protein BCV71DRAFT_266321 [Rhizopus microsporus]|uniref:Uncharacterized protein n=1 Tax=Rhizopus microsporus TaxID=58291 RepID=A0A1X0RUX3_RHIZD|nr:hypothetical protein BCV71DRAFT_266321 [Rhizopus microsporus]